MHLGDSIFIFVLALVLFGPKRLPEIARQVGKLMAEFRRASNEFKMQMDEELRSMENQERQKQISEAALQNTSAPAPGTSQLNIMPPSTGEHVSRIPSPEEAAAIAAATPLEEPVNRIHPEPNGDIRPEPNGDYPQTPEPEPEQAAANHD